MRPDREQCHAFLRFVFAMYDITHFRVTEILFDRAAVPPWALWGNIIPTLIIAERMRRHFGRPVTISSAYRDPAYNRREGGSKGSEHLFWGALDVEVADVSPDDVADWLEAQPEASMMGIGRYDGFTHFDTRGWFARHRISPARWDLRT